MWVSHGRCMRATWGRDRATRGGGRLIFFHEVAVAFAVLVVVVVLAAGVHFAESAVRVRSDKRVRADESVARAMGVQWEHAEVRTPDDLVLRGWLLVPNEWNGEAVMAMHGFTSTRLGMVERARLHLRCGFAVLMPDMRGHGASDGEIVTFGAKEAADVRLWGDWLCERLGVKNFWGHGQSMGSAVLIAALPQEPRLRGVVAESAYAKFRDVAYDRMAARVGISRTLARTALLLVGEWGLLYARLRYGVSLRRVKPVEAIRETRVPVLLIHGSQDEAIPPYHSQRLHSVNREMTHLWIVQGAGHTTSLEVGGEQYERLVTEWFTLRPAGSRG